MCLSSDTMASAAAAAATGAGASVEEPEEGHRLDLVGRGTRLTAYTKHLHTLASDPKADWVQEVSFRKGIESNSSTELARLFTRVQMLRDDPVVRHALGHEDLRVSFTGDGKGAMIVAVDDVLWPSFRLRASVSTTTGNAKLLHVSNPVPGLGPLKLTGVRVTWEAAKLNAHGRALSIRDPCTGFDIVISTFPLSF